MDNCDLNLHRISSNKGNKDTRRANDRIEESLLELEERGRRAGIARL